MSHEYLPGNVRERLKDLLSGNHMSQKQLAETIGIHESTISRFIKGETDKLSNENIVAIAKVFDVSTDFLLGLTDVPYKTNYDIEELGLTVEAAKKLYTGEVNPEVVNMLLTNEHFAMMTEQIAQLREGTVAAGIASMNQIINSISSQIGQYARRNPEDRYAAKRAVQDARTLRCSPYSVDTKAIETSFTLLLNDLKQGAKEYVDRSTKLTQDVMDRMITSLTKGSGRFKPHAITPEMMVDSILNTTGDLEMSDGEREQLRTALLPMFKKPAKQGKHHRTA